VFERVGLDWHDHVVSDGQLFRPSDIGWSQGDASLAKTCLGWESTIKMPALAARLVDEVRGQ
jgi:GDPmannose 4,6-dehydratase